MNIEFQAPPNTTSLANFDPANKDHYPDLSEEGIYIYGIRLRVNSELKFVPVVVGEGSLQSRLYIGHYQKKFLNPINYLAGYSVKSCGDPKEIWDFSKLDVNDMDLNGLYSDICTYNYPLSKISSKTLMASRLVHLLYFQDVNFYNHRFGIIPNSGTVNLNVVQAIQYLASLHSLSSAQSIHEMTTRIILTLYNFKEHFYYVYASSNDYPALINKKTRQSIEFNIKERLKLINIYTSAKATGKIAPSLLFDFSNIQDDLLCIGNHNYLNPTGGYIKPLVL